MAKAQNEARCWRCGMPANALIHTGTANAHHFEPQQPADAVDRTRTS